MSGPDASGDAAAAAAVAGVLSGIPSTAYAVATGRHPLEATVAAGSIVLPRERRRGRLLAAALPAHAAITLFWSVVLARLLPARHEVLLGGAAGLGIAVLDLLVIGRRMPMIRALPLAPQVADHLAFGVSAGAVIGRRRALRAQRR